MRKSLQAVATVAALLAASPVLSHELVVKPGKTRAGEGEVVPVSIMLTERYIIPHRMPPETTTLTVVTDGGEQSVAVAADEDAMQYTAKVEAPSASPFLLYGYSTRSRPRRARDGGDMGEGEPGMLTMQTFSKVIVNLADTGEAFELALGAPLEIVPMVNPGTLRPGDTLEVKVLFNGEPVSTRVQATYDGYSSEEHGYVVRTETGADGVARVEMADPGLWLVRTKHAHDVEGSKDRNEYTATLIFRLGDE